MIYIQSIVMQTLWVFSLSFCGLMVTPAGAAPARIALAGDSTVRDYTGMSPDYAELKGWGQYVQELTEPGSVVVLNHGKGGCSSKSFIAEGRWDKLLADKPDYVFIQFGHNDIPNKGPERETLAGPVPDVLPAEGLGSKPDDYYRFNLRKYLEDARAAGAVPIVVTPMERRSFTSNGKSVRLKNQPWSDAAKAVAEEMGAHVIDLNAYSVELYNRLGEDGSGVLHPMRSGEKDNTHYNEAGARIWAEYIVQQLGEVEPTLKEHLRLPATRTVEQVIPTPAK